MTEAAEIVATRPPVHPGEVLREEFMTPLKLTPEAVARACRVPPIRIEQVADGMTGIDADLALRLAKFFGIEPLFWINLQSDFDLRTTRSAIGADLTAIERHVPDAA